MERQWVTPARQPDRQGKTLCSKSAVPTRGPVHPILRIQQTIGNQAVGRLIQAKLKVSQPGEVYEQEADRMADAVMRTPAQALQRTAAAYAAGGPACSKCQGEKETLVQRKGGRVSEDFAPDSFHTLGSGQPLDLATRTFMESRFDHDFSQVRLHTDARAAESARAVNALAYTVGRDVVFAEGQYKVETTAGKRLLAHELTHVVQQVAGVAQTTLSPKALAESIEKENSEASQQVIFETSPNRNTSRRSVCGSCSGHRSVAHVNTDGLPASSIADPFFIAIDGLPTPEMTVRQSTATPSILRQPVPAPNSIRVVQNHQFPITAAHVGLGWRSGFGGVSEIEASNGSTNYNGTNISEHFLFGFGNNNHIGGCNNQSGQGGQGGSTFTVGRGVSFSLNGLNINLPPKRNTFYDMHIKGFGVNILPPGTNSQFSLCLQRYSFGGRTIFGRLGGLLPAFFYRFHGIERKTVGGQDVANINLRKG